MAKSGNSLWDAVVNNLCAEKSGVEPRTFRCPLGAPEQPVGDRPTVRLIERYTRTTIIVAWQDSTSCHYGEQVWALSIARKSGKCALTGARIEVGQAIYRPRIGKRQPRNALAMICARTLTLNERDLVGHSI